MRWWAPRPLWVPCKGRTNGPVKVPNWLPPFYPILGLYHSVLDLFPVQRPGNHDHRPPNGILIRRRDPNDSIECGGGLPRPLWVPCKGRTNGPVKVPNWLTPFYPHFGPLSLSFGPFPGPTARKPRPPATKWHFNPKKGSK